MMYKSLIHSNYIEGVYMKDIKKNHTLMIIVFAVCFFLNLPFSHQLYKDESIMELFVVLISFLYMMAFPFFFFGEKKCREKE